ncbi:MAG: signal peptidase I [Phaeospirillum sp.]|nr:signal peptidase I [Phaeospirillum sp.]
MSKGKSGGVMETVRTIVYAMVIAGGVRTVAFEPFNIPSGSMIPSLLIGDYLFVSKSAYGYSRHSMPFSIGPGGGRVMEKVPERGDVIVFKKPPEARIDYIKRAVGLPGDRIQVKGGILHINGVPVDRQRIEDFIERDRDGNIFRAPQYVETLPNGKKHNIIESHGDNGPADNTPEYKVPAGHYFMMGDNRDNSADSRFLSEVGYVPAENLVGRAEVLFFSGDGSAALWEVWRWPWAIRYSRLFQGIQ